MTLGCFLSGVVSRWLKSEQILEMGESVAAEAVCIAVFFAAAVATLLMVRRTGKDEKYD